MEQYCSRNNTKDRTPLTEDHNRANMRRTPSRTDNHGKAIANARLPHHESLMPMGPHTVQDAISPRTHRLRALANEESQELKRNSQVSTTSTNASTKGKRRKTHIGPWQLGMVIGQGGIGKVRKVRHCVTGQEAAVKIIPKAVAEKARAESLASLVESSKKTPGGLGGDPDFFMPFGVEREVVILKLLEHPNIVKLYDVWENRDELYLIMEYVDGGELFGYITDRETVPEDETVWLFRQVIAALLYCHRLGIHHRDLKPENILVDPKTHQIKLADFGMAALQPQGEKLTTPCGSMHYAAPEVFEKSYDGAKADVWSLGVILYVMLTGTTPFNYDPTTMATRVALWYKVLKSGRFPMPDDLSWEAQDLLRKMLTVDIKQRISLEAIWHHPFIHKFDSSWDETPAMTSMERWIGHRPYVKDWSVHTRDDIDREIFRNIRTLWHHSKEEDLIKKLLSKDANQQKYFYSALQKHREDQLENYIADTDTINSSGSDYHHIKQDSRRRDGPTLPIIKAPKTNSVYSVLNNEHLHSRSTLREASPSIRSYDPYRASRSTVAGGTSNYLKINGQQGQTRPDAKLCATDSTRRPASLRVEALKNEQQRRVSGGSSVSSLHHSTTSFRSRPGTAVRRSFSRSSMASSLIASSSPGVVKPSMHKRPVQFHSRSSGASVTTSRSGTRISSSPRKHAVIRGERTEPYLHDPDSSPVALMHTVVRGRKEVLRGNPPPSRLRKSHTQDDVFDKEARKVSTELEKFCEEAFNRVSIGSSSRNSATPSQAAHDTPPSSVSNRGSGVPETTDSGKLSTPVLRRGGAVESPNTVIQQELAETRKRLAARYAQDENAQNPNYHDVMAHLDALLQHNSPSFTLPEFKRTGSGYVSRATHLPVISEEGKHGDMDSKQSRSHHTSNSASTTRPFTKSDPGLLDKCSSRNASPPPQIAPLVIRKTSGSSTRSQYQTAEVAPVRYVASHSANRLVRKISPASAAASGSLHRVAEAIQPDDRVCGSSDADKQVKKGNWFSRRFQPTDTQEVKQNKKFNIYEDNAKASSSEDWTFKAIQISELQETEAGVKEKQQATSDGMAGKRPGFLKFLSRKRQKKPSISTPMPYSEDADEASLTSTTAVSVSERGGTDTFHRQNHHLDQNERNDPKDLGVQRNWLSRFLNIKPVTRILCFNTGRGRARGELVRLLRSWRRFGIKDVMVDRARNLVFGRLDAVNHLGIREVSFVVEIYVILKEGRRAGLSVARFTQQKGAASSFRRVTDAVEGMLRGRGCMVERGEKWREMEAVLVDGST